jgi:hypothetical protein
MPVLQLGPIAKLSSADNWHIFLIVSMKAEKSSIIAFPVKPIIATKN